MISRNVTIISSRTLFALKISVISYSVRTAAVGEEHRESGEGDSPDRVGGKRHGPWRR